MMRPFLPTSLILASTPFCLAQSPELREAITPSTPLDELVVAGSPLARTAFQLVQPATVLTGPELQREIQPTLGETLDWQPGISSTSFGPGASRPIIRGLGDDRLRVLQNGTSVIDVSNVSPDHAVAVDPLSVRSVEIVRGPATLLYGPNAVGGVVNIIDNRIPEERYARPTGALDARYGTADDLKSLAGAVNFSAGPLAFHLDAFARETHDIEIPGYARSRRLRENDPQADEARGHLPNSFTESSGGAAGTSYIWDSGFIGFSYSGMDSLYGTVAEEDVTIDLKQRRWDVRGAFRDPASWIREINYKFGQSDYNHTEFEGDEVGTRFAIDGFNARTELQHNKFGAFEGAFGLEVQRADFSALGDEAFLPPVENRSASLFLFEEIDFDPYTFQFGARYDRQENETDFAKRGFDAFSTSGGIVYTPAENYAISLSLGYSERPPTYVELFADGLHVATGTFEIGDPGLDTEDSISIDLSLRKRAGRVTGTASAFYYRFSNFISLSPTGGTFDDEGELFPEFAFRGTGADFYGGEIETVFHLLEPMENGGEEDLRRQRLDLILRADYVRAEERGSGDPIPRIPPFRASLALDYHRDCFGARLEGQWAANQGRNAVFELPTDGYFLLSLGLTYQLTLGEVDTTFFAKGVNLTDEEARQSTSFLKDVAPLAGRGLVLGMRSEF